MIENSSNYVVKNAFGLTPDDPLPMRENKYTLFAVINHIGNIEAGHYTSFIRSVFLVAEQVFKV